MPVFAICEMDWHESLVWGWETNFAANEHCSHTD